jgi:hypothetical protein
MSCYELLIIWQIMNNEIEMSKTLLKIIPTTKQTTWKHSERKEEQYTIKKHNKTKTYSYVWIPVFIPAEWENLNQELKSRKQYQKQTHRQQNTHINDCQLMTIRMM